jgi:hypothetical protein
MYDLLEAKGAGLRGSAPDQKSATEVFHDMALKGRCSALITVTCEYYPYPKLPI